MQKRRTKPGPKIGVFGKKIRRNFTISTEVLDKLQRLSRLAKCSASAWVERQIITAERNDFVAQYKVITRSPSVKKTRITEENIGDSPESSES